MTPGRQSTRSEHRGTTLETSSRGLTTKLTCRGRCNDATPLNNRMRPRSRSSDWFGGAPLSHSRNRILTPLLFPVLALRYGTLRGRNFPSTGSGRWFSSEGRDLRRLCSPSRRSEGGTGDATGNRAKNSADDSPVVQVKKLEMH